MMWECAHSLQAEARTGPHQHRQSPAPLSCPHWGRGNGTGTPEPQIWCFVAKEIVVMLQKEMPPALARPAMRSFQHPSKQAGI